MERWRDRIIEGIDSGFLLNARGDRIMLTEENGIDLLGNYL